MPEGLTLRGKALPVWMREPDLLLPFSVWWHQGLWARGVLRSVTGSSNDGARSSANVLVDVLAWADDAVHAPWCRQDVGHALKQWAQDVHAKRMKPAWEHAADLEALLTLVRPNMDDPRLLRWAHPDAIWSAWDRWDVRQRENSSRWMAVQASTLVIMADWWRRSCAPDHRPDHWYGVANPWSLSTQTGWVVRWSERVIHVVQGVMINAGNWSPQRRMLWIRWVDRLLLETWPNCGIDDSDLFSLTFTWNRWISRQPWRTMRSALEPSPILAQPAVAMITAHAAVAVERALRHDPVSTFDSSGKPMALLPSSSDHERPWPPSPSVAIAQEWITVPDKGWGQNGFSPILDAMDPACWPQDMTLWWRHRKGEKTPATQAWNTLWSHLSAPHDKVRAMLMLSETYSTGAHGLRTSLVLRDRWTALFEHARRPSPEWITADWKSAKVALRWNAGEDQTIVPLTQSLGALNSHAAWCAWLQWDETYLMPRSDDWSATFRAYRAVLRHGYNLIKGAGSGSKLSWKARWTVWVEAALAWETTLSKLPEVGDAWAQAFRDRVTQRLMANADRLPKDESWEGMDAWLSSETQPLAVWEMALLRPSNVLVPAGPLKVLAKEPVLDRTKEVDLRIIVDRCAPLWTGCRVAPVANDALNITMALNEQFPWFEAVTHRLSRRLAMRNNMGSSFRLPTLLLVGPPGVGKTSYLRAFANAMQVPFAVLGLNGMTDNRMLAGTARGYSNMRPAWPVEFMAREQCANPLLVLDEIDKVAQGQQTGRVWDTLLGLTERGSAAAWMDECLLTPVDLSGISWLATANDVQNMPEALISRFEVIAVNGPSWSNPQHQRAALHRIRRDLAEAWDCADVNKMPWLEPAQESLLWTREWSSLRHLARAVESTIENTVLQRTSRQGTSNEVVAPTSVEPPQGRSDSVQASPWRTWISNGAGG